MRCSPILGAMGLCLCLCGCRMAVDIAQNAYFETRLLALDVKAKVYYPMLARSAWECYCSQCPDHAGSKNFACGFKRGYADYLENGGDASTHLAPPVRYWQIRHDTPAGREAIAQWQAGFREGAQAARKSGQRELIVVPVADAPRAGPPPSGPPPGGPPPVATPPGASVSPPPSGPTLDPPPPAPDAPDAPLLPHPQMLPPSSEDKKNVLPPAPPPLPPPAPSPKVAPSPPSAKRTDEELPRINPSTDAGQSQANLPRVLNGYVGTDLPRVAPSKPVAEPLPAASNKPVEPADQQPSLPSLPSVNMEKEIPALADGSVDWDRFPRDADMLSHVGSLLLKAGNVDGGLQWLALALQVNPDHGASHQALMEYYQARGDFFHAAEHRVKAEKAAAAETADESESGQ